METLISVIVPVYKVEKYLCECLDSIINQTYKNLEIILVDDGSPDNCGDICDEYAKKDKRIVVIHKKNGGLSDARNAGMASCKGKYIMFVDSDDILVSDAIEYLFGFIVSDEISLVIGGVEKFWDKDGKVMFSTEERGNNISVMSREEAIKDYLQLGCEAWARLYKREVHENILFPVGEINEDDAVVLRMLDQCNTVVRTNRVIYRYRYRENSITSSAFNKEKLLRYIHYKNNLTFIKEKYPELTEYAEIKYYTCIVWCLNNMTATPLKFKPEIKALRGDLKSGLKKSIRSGSISAREKLRSLLIAYLYYPYALAVKLLNKHYT